MRHLDEVVFSSVAPSLADSGEIVTDYILLAATRTPDHGGRVLTRSSGMPLWAARGILDQALADMAGIEASCEDE